MRTSRKRVSRKVSPKSPLNRVTGPQVIKLFDYCFRQGVFDACDFGDDITVQEWLDARLADGGYGLLSECGEEFDWKRWRLVLYRWCRIGQIGIIGESYVDVIHKYKATSIFALLPMCMRFYLMGIEEWLAYPNPNNIALFKQKKKIHWKPFPSHLMNIRTTDFISYLQEFVYERVNKHFEDDLNQSRYDSFSTGVWRCNQKYYYADENTEEDPDSPC